MLRWALGCLVVILGTTGVVHAGGASPGGGATRQPGVVSGIIVTFKSPTDEAAASAAASRLSTRAGFALRFERIMGGGEILYKFEPRSVASVQSAVSKLKADPAIRAVEPDSVMTIQPVR